MIELKKFLWRLRKYRLRITKQRRDICRPNVNSNTVTVISRRREGEKGAWLIR